jgi:hypothetical protein
MHLGPRFFPSSFLFPHLFLCLFPFSFPVPLSLLSFFCFFFGVPPLADDVACLHDIEAVDGGGEAWCFQLLQVVVVDGTALNV